MQLSRTALILAIIPIIYNTACYAACINIVYESQPRAVIVQYPNTTPENFKVASILQIYIEKATNAKLPILNSIDRLNNHKQNVIWLGARELAEHFGVQTNTLNDDGFVITSPDAQSIIITGRTDSGVEFGAYEFLERFVGIRWLFPGAEGEHVPQIRDLCVPRDTVRQQPAFFSRRLSGLKGNVQNEWARRNRMCERVAFHHNLYKIYPPDVYAAQHPEFYPMRSGKRYLPSMTQEGGWQPCFSAHAIADEAIKYIRRFFSNNSTATWFSLGANDSGGYCDCDLSGRTNSLGYHDASDSYFSWANTVVEGVLRSYPDKWFGCLAYSELADPPSKVKVHSRIIPFMTFDRLKWVDKTQEITGKRLTEQWAKSANYLGWYDYIYGTPYLVPRVYFHHMADYYRYGYEHNVRAVYAEAYPNWGEGPKVYITLKLLWNPYADVDKMLDDWFVCAVGEQARKYLAAYYKLWEEFWTKSLPQQNPNWLTRKGQYLEFFDPAYLRLLPPDAISKSRHLLEMTVSEAKTDKQRRRAILLLRAFEYYEASVISFEGLVQHKIGPGKTDNYYRAMRDKRYQLIKEFEADDVLLHPIKIDGSYFKLLNW
jgi:hypothetical protein